MRHALLTFWLTAALVGVTHGQSNETSNASANAPEAAPPPAEAGSSTNSPFAQINRPGSFGVGALLGEPMGASVKMWVNPKVSIDGAAGWSFVEPDGFQLHGDVLWDVATLFHGQESELPLYVGVGGRVKFVEEGDNRAGFRGPVGVSYLLHKQRLELFAEVVPVLDIAPKTTLEWNGGIGIRYYFR
jgi:hypothetical protein